MSRLSSARFFQPSLEQLEDRVQPSFLLGGNAVQQMAEPLNNIVQDMKAAAGHLTFDLNAGTNALNKGNVNLGVSFYSTAVGDFQQLLVDQHAIKAVSAANQDFVKGIALAEFQSGDSLDLFVLYLNFGNPLKPLTDPVDQANDLMNSQDVKNDIAIMNKATLGGITLMNHITQPKF